MRSKVGKVGGGNVSATLRTFSDGFGWSNLEMPSSVADSVFPWRTANSTLVDPKRRAKAKSSNVGEDADTPVDSMMICDDPNNNTNVTVNCKAKCSFHWLAPSTERLISCATARRDKYDSAPPT